MHPHPVVAFASTDMLLRSEAILRILKCRSTIEHEAQRMQVDRWTVLGWLEATFLAASRELDHALVQGSPHSG